MNPTKPFYTLAKQLIDYRVDCGEFAGYSDRELAGKVDELAGNLRQAWDDAHAQMLDDEPTDEDHRIWAAEARRDQIREDAA